MISWAGNDDTAAVRALWETAFGDEQPYTDWYFREVYRPERTLVFKQNGSLLSALQLAPYRLQTPHGAQNAAFIVGVATQPAAQNRGYARALLRQALTELHQQGYMLALLYTDIPAFYAPLGFSCCYQLRQLIFPAARKLTFPAAPQPLPAAFRRCQPNSADLAACDRIYRQMCADFQGYIIRSPRNWQLYCEDWLSGGLNQLWLAEDAYLLTDISPDCFGIKEIGYLNPAALQRALNLAAGLAAQAGFATFSWAAPQLAPLPRQANEKVRPWVMARLTANVYIPADQAAAAVRNYLSAPAPQLWINEIT